MYHASIGPKAPTWYRTVISHTQKAVNEVDMGKDPHFSSLVANFSRVSDKQRMSVPPWDLALVVKQLNEALLEPMYKAQIKFTTLKTVFLVALASGKHRSEIHAIRKEILHSED